MLNLFGCYNVRICDNLFIWDKDMKFLWRSLSFYSNDMQKKKRCNLLEFFFYLNVNKVPIIHYIQKNNPLISSVS
jgi:hypothetical protein